MSKAEIPPTGSSWDNLGLEEETDDNIALLDVFAIGLILEKVESFLAWEDLRMLREVCWGMNGVILNNTKFRLHCILKLKKSVLLDESFKSFSFQPNHLQIRPFTMERGEEGDQLIGEITSRVCELARFCESLEISNLEEDDDRNSEYNSESDSESDSPPRSTSTVKPYSEKFVWDKNEEYYKKNLIVHPVPKHAPIILTVLLSTRNLVALHFKSGAEGLLRGSNENQSSCLANLKVLEFSDSLSFSSFLYIPKIFLGLRRQLKVLRLVDEYKAIHGSHEIQEFPSEQNRRLYTIMWNNKDTLVDTGVLHPANGQDYLNEKYFPTLTTLFILDFKRYCPVNDYIPGNRRALYRFLHTYATQLQHLELSYTVEGNEFVREILRANSVRGLKTLRIMTFFLLSLNPINALVQNIAASTLTSIDFCGIDPYYWGSQREFPEPNDRFKAWNAMEKCIDILCFMPPTIKALKFENVGESVFLFNPLMVSKISLLQSLCINRNYDITDEFIQAVCAHCTELKTLKLETVRGGVTPKALLGFNYLDPEDRNFSLSATPIANLRHLQILALDGIFDNTGGGFYDAIVHEASVSYFLSRVQCKSINTFKISTLADLRIKKSPVLTFLQNNSYVEILKCPMNKKELVGSLSDFRQFPNLRRVNGLSLQTLAWEEAKSTSI